MSSSKIIQQNFKKDGQLKSVYTVTRNDSGQENLSNKSVKIPKLSFYIAAAVSIIILMLLIGVTIVYSAPRPGLYKESCDKKSCLADHNLKCMNKTCKCEDNYFYTTKCIIKKSYMEKCHLTSYCFNNLNMSCLDGVCKCNDMKYWSGSTCVNKKTINQSCQNYNLVFS